MPPTRRELLDAVALAVGAVPPGTTVSYGEIARLVGTGPRQVGAALAQLGDEVDWWRVIRSDGRIAAHLVAEATRRLSAEGVSVVDGRVRRV